MLDCLYNNKKGGDAMIQKALTAMALIIALISLTVNKFIFKEVMPETVTVRSDELNQN